MICAGNLLIGRRQSISDAVPGEITIQCLEGSVDVTAGDATDSKTHTLTAGQLLYLAGGVPHGLIGIQDASVLVTIALRR